MPAPLDVSALSAAWAATFATVAVKALVLLALALGGALLLRRAAASTRHFLWTATVVGLLALPLLGNTIPGWSIDGLAVPTVRTEPAAAEDDGGPTMLYVSFVADEATEGTWTATAEPPVRDAQLPPQIVQPIRIEKTDPAPSPAVAFLRSTFDAMRNWSAWTWTMLVWELGVLLVLGWLAAGWIGLRRLEARSTVVTDAAWIGAAEVAADEMGLRRVPKLLRTDDTMTPLTWGVFRSKVLVPSSADDWSDERRIDVLRHEFAHVARRDVLTQFLAQIACAVFWFHPLPWMAASRMRLERERAADDRVLLAGSRASAYAGHLLEMARTLRSEHGLAAASIGMARRSQLGERMDSLLDEKGRPRATSWGTRVVLGLLIAGLVLPLATLRPDTLEAAPPERDDDRAFFPAPPAPPALEAPPVTTAVGPIAQLRERVARTVPSSPRAPRPAAAPRLYSISPGQRAFAVSSDAPAVVVSGDGFTFGEGHWVQGPLVTDGYEVETRHTTWRSDDGDRTVEVEISGRVRFFEDETDVELLDEDSYFDLYVEEGRDRRRIEIDVDRDGEERRRYFVRGRAADFDDEAKAWMSDAITEFMMLAGVAVGPRIDRWIEEDGVDATIERVEDMDSDMVASTHWATLLDHDALDADAKQRVLRTMRRAIDSDFQKGQMLHHALEALVVEEALHDDTIAFIESIDSDFTRGAVIREALAIEGLDEDFADRILILADGMDSDFEKARVLGSFPRARLRSGDSANAFFHVLRGVDSDFEKTRTLIDALPLALDDADARAQMWETVEDIDSDFEKANLIAALAPKLTDDVMVTEAFAVIDGIDSDFEKARVLGEFVDYVADGSEEIRREFTRVADQIDSDHEYGRLMRELRAAGR